jgi:hypothetical protein
MLLWLKEYEFLWLFIILVIGMIAELYSAIILTIEYNYDKEFNEQLKEAKRVARKKKVELESESLTTGEMK